MVLPDIHGAETVITPQPPQNSAPLDTRPPQYRREAGLGASYEGRKGWLDTESLANMFMVAWSGARRRWLFGGASVN